MNTNDLAEPSNVPSSESSKPREKRRAIFLFGILIALLAVIGIGWKYMLSMPGQSFTGTPQYSEPIPDVAPANVNANASSETAQTSSVPAEKPLATPEYLERDVSQLAVTIGERNLQRYDSLEASADWIEKRLTDLGYEIRRETFQVRGLDCHNIEAEKQGTELPDEIVIVGAHYDSVTGTPGANDNGSGTAAMLWLAEKFSKVETKRTLRFVAFTNEEPPYFQTDEMGSYVYAKACRQRNENLAAVLSLETMAYFTDEEDSQHYPGALAPFYPSVGNFIGFVGNLGSRPLLNKAIKTFRDNANFPSEGAVLPGAIPGVGWSDHWSFWQEGYQGIMITDTAPFRYPHYHEETDLPDQIDFEKFAIVVEGLVPVVTTFADNLE